MDADQQRILNAEISRLLKYFKSADILTAVANHLEADSATANAAQANHLESLADQLRRPAHFAALKSL